MHPLDNVIWQALGTRQTEFAQSSGTARKFLPEVSSLAGFVEPSKQGYDSLASLVETGETVRISLTEPYQPQPGWAMVASGPMPQMIYEGERKLFVPAAGVEMIDLRNADVPAMLDLTTVTKPGPFNRRTRELGRYVGIYSEGALVAMAGERMKVPGYTEVSAVCTRPGHTGRGYAGLLMSGVMRGILDRREIPFLHVREENVQAIQLYERLGFRRRITSQLVVLRKD
jgi:ribosomal protein S18 acetylase RimI-like enzyme